jgi:dolichyl-phosphate beta-glucosyltransferase
MKYSIVIPCYQEAKVLRGSLVRIAAYLDDNDLSSDTEVLVCLQGKDDGSKDIFDIERSRFSNIRIIDGGASGKGLNVRRGIEASKGNSVIFTDADLATPEYYIKEAFDALEGDADVVIGVRSLRKIHKGYRTIISVMSNIFIRAILLPKIPDTQCGFKGFKRNAADIIFSNSTIDGWGFDVEILYIATLHKMNIQKIKILDWHDPKIDKGLTGQNPLKAISNTFIEVAKIRKNAFKKTYTK